MAQDNQFSNLEMEVVQLLLQGKSNKLTALAREGFEAFYAEDRYCYLRHIATKTIVSAAINPHRPFSASELQRREQLLVYLNTISEDELIEGVFCLYSDSWDSTASPLVDTRIRHWSTARMCG